MRRPTPAVLGSAVASLVVALLVVLTPAPASGAIESDGPLTEIITTSDLNCNVQRDGSRQWFAGYSCGTFAALNGTLFGPEDFVGGGVPMTKTGWTPVSQSAPLGSGTAADPYVVVTVVRNGAGVTVTQRDSYVEGREEYETTVRITNGSAGVQRGHVYTAGDCQLEGSALGYGRVTGAAVACSTSTLPGAGVEQVTRARAAASISRGRTRRSGTPSTARTPCRTGAGAASTSTTPSRSAGR